MFELAGQISDLIAGCFRHAQALVKVNALWAALMLGLLLASGAYGALPEEGANLTTMLWQFGSLLALIVGWYASHRYLMNVEAGAHWVPPLGAMTRFIGSQVKLMTGLSFAGLMLVMPLVAMLTMDQYTHLDLAQPIPTPGQAMVNEATGARPDQPSFGEQDVRALISALGVNPDNPTMALEGGASPTMPALPWYINALFYAVMFIFFARFLLAAPLAARGLPRPLSRSWSTTRGHWLRLAVLQSIALAPAIFSMALVQSLDSPALPKLMHIWLAVVNVAGEFISVWLFVLLAEDEFAQLYTTPNAAE